MEVTTLVPDPGQIRIDYLAADDRAITLFAVTTRPQSVCPSCGHTSDRVHSRYVRTVCDLPWHGIAVRIRLTARRFFCDDPGCKRSIFAERLPGVVGHYARRTDRLQVALALLGYALGGEAGARVALGLGLAVSPDSLLRRVRQAAADDARPGALAVRVLGVDDWAYRRGQRYGTILVDLEKHRLGDLLPDRSAESLGEWLKRHPGVEVISRDRCELYADGGRAGAPDAKQIADRWHLLKNVGEAMDRALMRHHRQIREAAAQTMDQAPCSVKVQPRTSAIKEKPPREPTRAEQDQQEGRARRHARWSEVRELHRQGMSQRDISRKTGLSTKTIRRYIRSANCPYYPPVRRTRRTLLTPFEAHLKTRWEQGCHNAATLYKELRGQGFAGGYSTLRAFVRGWRGRLPPDVRAQGEALRSREILPSPRTVRWWLMGHTSKTNAEKRAWQEKLIDTLCTLSPDVRILQNIACGFGALLKDRCVPALTQWLEEAERCGIQEMAQLAKGMRRDMDAVAEGVRGEWSNGQTEGQVNRLKLIKRSMYGRAKFDLLRARVLPLPRAA